MLRKRWFFPLLAVLMLVPWPVAYAFDSARAQVETEEVSITPAPPPEMPRWKAFGNAVGGVSQPGNLFYLDATESTMDFPVTLYLTNASELAGAYRYLHLRVGVYVQNGAGGWEKASGPDSKPFPDTYLTLRNGQVSLHLMGGAKYKVTVDGGSFYFYGGDSSAASPQFFLALD